MNIIELNFLRYAEMYTQISLILIATIVFIFIGSKRNPMQTIYSQYFDRANFHIISMIVSDLIWKLMEIGLIPKIYILGYIVNVAYFISMNLYVFNCFVYFEYMIDRKNIYSTKYREMIKIPVYILSIFAIISPLTNKLFFYIDKDFNYTRGPLYFVMYTPFIYWVLSAVFAYRKLKEYKNKKVLIPKIYYWIVVFPVLPMFFGYMGMVSHTIIPYFQIGATLNLMLYYIAMLEKTISFDELSDLATTHTIIKYMNNCTKSRNIKTIYLAVFKIDNLRDISKDVGVTEAQSVIIHTGDVFKFICNYPEYKGFVPGKISENVFAVVAPNTDAEDIEKFSDLIIEHIKEIENTLNCKLTVSSWYNKYNRYIDIRDFITYSRENIKA